MNDLFPPLFSRAACLLAESGSLVGRRAWAALRVFVPQPPRVVVGAFSPFTVTGVTAVWPSLTAAPAALGSPPGAARLARLMRLAAVLISTWLQCVDSLWNRMAPFCLQRSAFGRLSAGSVKALGNRTSGISRVPTLHVT